MHVQHKDRRGKCGMQPSILGGGEANLSASRRMAQHLRRVICSVRMPWQSTRRCSSWLPSSRSCSIGPCLGVCRMSETGENDRTCRAGLDAEKDNPAAPMHRAGLRIHLTQKRCRRDIPAAASIARMSFSQWPRPGASWAYLQCWRRVRFATFVVSQRSRCVAHRSNIREHCKIVGPRLHVQLSLCSGIYRHAKKTDQGTWGSLDSKLFTILHSLHHATMLPASRLAPRASRFGFAFRHLKESRSRKGRRTKTHKHAGFNKF